MNFFGVLLVWLVIAAIFTVGIVMAANGSLAMLVIAVVAFTLAFSKWGCATH